MDVGHVLNRVIKHRILGRGKCSLKNIAVDARLVHKLSMLFLAGYVSQVKFVLIRIVHEQPGIMYTLSL